MSGEPSLKRSMVGTHLKNEDMIRLTKFIEKFGFSSKSEALEKIISKSLSMIELTEEDIANARKIEDEIMTKRLKRRERIKAQKRGTINVNERSWVHKSDS